MSNFLKLLLVYQKSHDMSDESLSESESDSLTQKKLFIHTQKSPVRVEINYSSASHVNAVKRRLTYVSYQLRWKREV